MIVFVLNKHEPHDLPYFLFDLVLSQVAFLPDRTRGAHAEAGVLGLTNVCESGY